MKPAIRVMATAVSALLLALVMVASALAAPGLKGYQWISLDKGARTGSDAFLGKPVLVSFFTPLCPYCREELRELEGLAPKYRGKVNIVALAPETSSQAAVSAVLARWGIRTIPGYLDSGNRMYQAFRVDAVPFSALFDKEGKLIRSTVGLIPAEELKALLDGAIR
jgi:thioredoxin-like negative regulator of GroEL